MTETTPASRVLCPNCKGALDPADYNLPALLPCRHCSTEIRALVFPALHSDPAESRGGTEAAEGEAACFFHSAKKAEVPCDQCGRFLCALCDIPFRGEHWCAACLQGGVAKQDRPVFVKRRTHYDALALMLASVPFAFFVWPSIIGGPAALYTSTKDWNQPAGILPRGRGRLYLAAGFAAIQAIGWIWLAVYLVMRLRGVA